MKKNIPTPLVDEYLESLQQAKKVETDPFFYTRLKARMENEIAQEGRAILKPGWLVGALSLFLVVNSYFVATGSWQNKETSVQGTSLQNFASEYNLSVSTPY